MITFTTRIQKFGKQGEKSGWTYVEVTARQAEQLKPGCRVSFRVKGLLDHYAIKQVAMMPMGEGNFILPLNATMRKGIGKKEGDKINVTLGLDEREIVLSPDLMACLKDEPALLKAFKKLPGSHQKYYSRWIESAKTAPTKAKRIALALESFARKQSFSEMIRESKAKR